MSETLNRFSKYAAVAASLKLTAVGLLGLLSSAMVIQMQWTETSVALVPPLTLLALNLLAAMAVNRTFRRQAGLLGFHVALLAVIVLAALGRMTYLKGGGEVTEGLPFTGEMTVVESGPWHRNRLQGVSFINERFVIDYSPEVTIRRTENHVRYRAPDGEMRSQIVTEQRPLVLEGYRFYISTNKGFAPVFLWHPADGSMPQAGSLHLPRFPTHRDAQHLDWTIPGTDLDLWVQLDIEEPMLEPGRESRLQVPKAFKMVVRHGDARAELRAGERMALPGGDLELVELRLWMGYHVYYDWTVPWMLAAATCAVLCLGWHFWQKFAAQPWDRRTAEATGAGST